MEHDGEEDEYDGHDEGKQDGEGQSHGPGMEEIGAEHGAKGPGEHHPFHGDVEDPGIVRVRPAQRREQDGGSARDRAVDQADEDAHASARSAALRRASSLSSTTPRYLRPATITSTSTACSTWLISLGTSVISSMPRAPVWMALKKSPYSTVPDQAIVRYDGDHDAVPRVVGSQALEESMRTRHDHEAAGQPGKRAGEQHHGHEVAVDVAAAQPGEKRVLAREPPFVSRLPPPEDEPRDSHRGEHEKDGAR